MEIIKWIFNTASSFNNLGNTKLLSRDNQPKIKDETYIINLDEYSDIGTHWIALRVNNSNVTYFDPFGVGHNPNEIKTFINRPLSSALKNKNIKRNIFRIQAYEVVMCGYF